MKKIAIYGKGGIGKINNYQFKREECFSLPEAAVIVDVKSIYVTSPWHRCRQLCIFCKGGDENEKK